MTDADIVKNRNDYVSDYASEEVITLRNEAGDLCSDPGCRLSGGFAHVGLCEPCNCGKLHAIEECPLVAPGIATERARRAEQQLARIEAAIREIERA